MMKGLQLLTGFLFISTRLFSKASSASPRVSSQTGNLKGSRMFSSKTFSIGHEIYRWFRPRPRELFTPRKHGFSVKLHSRHTDTHTHTHSTRQ